LRTDPQGESSLVCVSSFTPVPRAQYRVGVPHAGAWVVALNTDSEYYWGSNYDVGGLRFETEPTPWQGMAHSI
ncbi:alpha amylase C-terminal domain-containing protein, partial [Aeromonas diversa]